jgi:hypothetical protein
MSLQPGWSLLSLALRRSSEVALLLVGLVWVGSQVESIGQGLSLSSLCSLLAPIAGASGVAMALAEVRLRGEWSAWEAVGYSPSRQLAPIVLLLILGVLLQTQLSVGSVSSGLHLPAPVSQSAVSWPGVSEEGLEALAYWQRPPVTLGWRELTERMAEPAPLGARIGVDLAELVRRAGWIIAWPVGFLFGLLCGLRASALGPEKTWYGALEAAVFSGLSVLLWCLVVLGSSAAVAA